MRHYYIGIDNGVSGSVAILNHVANIMGHFPTPIKRSLSYTKKVQFITRVDVPALREILRGYAASQQDGSVVICLLERPFINPKMFRATISAVLAWGATLGVLEELGIPYHYIDSKEWQKALLPKGIKGSADLKVAAVEVCGRLFPRHKVTTTTADSLLIAEHARRTWTR